mgnify:CR=1 FL=1
MKGDKLLRLSQKNLKLDYFLKTWLFSVLRNFFGFKIKKKTNPWPLSGTDEQSP